jgi:hypothetical protein
MPEDLTVKIVSGGHPLSTRCMLDDGSILHGVRDITWRQPIDHFATAEVTLAVATVEVAGVLRAFVPHPITGRLERIASITFEDGTKWPSASEDVEA